MWELTIQRFSMSPITLCIDEDIKYILESRHIGKKPLPIVVYGSSEDYHAVKGIALFLGKDLQIYNTDSSIQTFDPFFALTKI